MALYKNVIRNVQREEEDDEEKLGYEFWNKVENAPVIKQIGNYFQQNNANIQAMNEYARSKENDNLLSKGLAWTAYGMEQAVGAPFQLIDMGLEEISDRTNIDKRSLRLGLDLFLASRNVKGSKTGAFNKGVQTRQGINKQYNKLANIFKKPGDQLIDIKSTRVFDDVAGLSLNDTGIAKLLNPIFTAKELGLDPSGTTFFSMQYSDPSDIPTYKGSYLDLDNAVHPTTYDGINTINTLLNKHGGLKSARLNLKAVNTKGHLSKRILSSVFLTPYGKGGNFKATVRNKKSVFYTMFGTEYEKMGLATKMKSGQATEPIQGHHGDSPLAVVLPGFEGIVKESPRYNRFVNVFLDEMLALGDMPENIRIVYGHVKRDPDGPHALSHAFGDFKFGKSGEKFWTKEKLDQIVVYDKDGNAIGTKNDDLREKFIRDQIVLLKENIEVLDNAMEQYKLLFAKKAFDPIELVDYFETKLPGIRDTELGGYLPMIMDKFVTGTVLEEAATVQANPITKADAKQIIANIFETENVRQWRKWSVPKRKARMAEITGGYSFERLEELIDKGWMDGNRLNKLFEDPLDDLK